MQWGTSWHHIANIQVWPCSGNQSFGREMMQADQERKSNRVPKIQPKLKLQKKTILKVSRQSYPCEYLNTFKSSRSRFLCLRHAGIGNVIFMYIEYWSDLASYSSKLFQGYPRDLSPWGIVLVLALTINFLFNSCLDYSRACCSVMSLFYDCVGFAYYCVVLLWGVCLFIAIEIWFLITDVRRWLCLGLMVYWIWCGPMQVVSVLVFKDWLLIKAYLVLCNCFSCLRVS